MYLIANGPAPTTAKAVAVTTGTTLKTMLQVKPGPTIGLRLVEWGISFNGSAAATPIAVEVLNTGSVFATVTAHVAAGIQRLGPASLQGGDPTTDIVEVGTSATGYTGSAEGAISESRALDAPQFIAPTTQFVKQFPLGREPYMEPGEAHRIRVHAPAAVDCYCYMVVTIAS